MQPFGNGQQHLLSAFRRLDLLLEREVMRLRGMGQFLDDPFRGLHIADAQIDAILHPKQADEPALAELTRQIAEVSEHNAARTTSALPLERLKACFDLSEFDADVLIIAVAAEVDDRYEKLFAYAQNDVTRKRPTVGLALRLLDGTKEGALARLQHFHATAPLFRHRLVRFAEDGQDRDPPFPARPLKVDARIVDFLLDRNKLDPQLASVAQMHAPATTLADLCLAKELCASLRNFAARFAGVGLFVGPAGSGKEAAAKALFTEVGLATLSADWRAIAPAGAGQTPETALGLLLREANLQHAGLYVQGCELLGGEEGHAGIKHLRSLCQEKIPVLLGSALPLAAPGLGLSTFLFTPPSFGPRRQMWERALNGSGVRVPPDDLADVAGQFRLGPAQIEEAAVAARRLAEVRTGDPHAVSAEDLHAAARAQSGHTLRKLARKVETTQAWDDLVVPPATLRQLRDVSANVRFRSTVLTAWGFERRLPYGKGITTLFSGPSGTGKTMAAAILARELRLDLYAIDLSAVVSKYIGETEKNLARVFDEARMSNAVLFFDEADALFGKRSAVKDAHDRYANIEVAFLLQKLEEFEGIVILATNLPRNIDDAFARRMQHAIDFPFPDAHHRERIWRSIFPPGVPLADDVNFVFLAKQFELSGGNIRNVALAAAFRAAEGAESLGMKHLVPTVARELRKMGRLPAKADFREYYQWIHEGA